ncbi:hypothetical protein H4219_003155 [Mycoemilia scoparia]|uniref:mannose-1-phosphate guanylyltransferase n=1 Tax=Mycoemilia scoparia TaxID=417184 RepID=A0A9W7ZWD5_9FUNG|nr:hypothetical protein H4219_003155 [Mycoemilia scoparia]
MTLNKAVILVGGPSRATRFRPLSMDIPQPLFPVGGKPIIWHQISALSKVEGLKEIILIGFFEDVVFRSFLDKCSDEYLREFTQLGTAGGLYHFRDMILRGNPKNVFVLYTDICSSFPLNELLKHHEKQGRVGTIMVTKVDRNLANNYGCVVVDNETSLALHYVEKPETYVSDLASTGIFVLDKEVFQFIEKTFQSRSADSGGEFFESAERDLNQLRFEQDVLRPMADQKKLSVYITKDFWRQIKSAASAVPANAAYLQQEMRHGSSRLAKSRPDGPKIVEPVFIHPYAQVDPEAKIGPNVSIQAQVKVGPGVRIRDAIVLEKSVIKENAIVLNAIIGRESRVGRWSRVEGSPYTTTNDGHEVTHGGVKVNNICILGQDVAVKDEVFVRNTVVLPHKDLSSDQHNEIIIAYATKQKKKSKVDPNAVTLDSALPAYAVGCPSHKIEAHIQCFPEKGQPPIRGSCVLPHGLQDNITIAVFAEGQKAQEAKEAGAHIVGGQDLIDKVKNGTVKFDKCLATPDILPSVAKVARILGPRGLMPTVNKGTVVDDVAGAVRYSLQSFDFKADKNNVVHSGFAKISFSAEQTLVCDYQTP